MRQFSETIFLGSGDYSLQEINRLKARLVEGIYILGGLQQPGHPESEEEAKAEKEWYQREKQNLLDVIADITVALGGEDPQK